MTLRHFSHCFCKKSLAVIDSIYWSAHSIPEVIALHYSSLMVRKMMWHSRLLRSSSHLRSLMDSGRSTISRCAYVVIRGTNGRFSLDTSLLRVPFTFRLWTASVVICALLSCLDRSRTLRMYHDFKSNWTNVFIRRPVTCPSR